jgi:hypothetical protein
VPVPAPNAACVADPESFRQHACLYGMCQSLLQDHLARESKIPLTTSITQMRMLQIYRTLS